MHIVYALIAILLGFGAILYPLQIVRTMGHIDWAEKYLGPGGSYTAWRIAGVIAIIGGIYFLTKML